jgi:hypothetical protein
MSPLVIQNYAVTGRLLAICRIREVFILMYIIHLRPEISNIRGWSRVPGFTQLILEETLTSLPPSPLIHLY